MRRVVTDAAIRDTKEGTVYPAPLASFPILSGFGAGYPDYPWFFGTDGAFTTYGLTATGQWNEAKNHLRTLREVSTAVNGLLHEIVTDGSIYFGTVAQPGDVEETPQFATAVATLWRWSGDNAFLDENYDFIPGCLRNPQHAPRPGSDCHHQFGTDTPLGDHRPTTSAIKGFQILLIPAPFLCERRPCSWPDFHHNLIKS